jgi:hypothetical protein
MRKGGAACRNTNSAGQVSIGTLILLEHPLLRRAILVGLILVLALVAGSHFLPLLRSQLLFGCMMICGVAGLLYAREAGRGYGRGALGGAVAGCVCALAAVGLAGMLDERPDRYLPLAVAVSTLTGGIGGLFGQWDSVLRARRRR